MGLGYLGLLNTGKRPKKASELFLNFQNAECTTFKTPNGEYSKSRIAVVQNADYSTFDKNEEQRRKTLHGQRISAPTYRA